MGSGLLPVLPNSCRAAWVAEDTGFQFAMVRSTDGKWLVGTNVFAMNVIGKMITNEALFTTSGLRTIRPISAMIHDIAYAKARISRKPPIASPTDERMRQPTSSPVADMITMTSTLFSTSLVVRPTSTAERDIGSDRNRSTMPFWMSSASPAPVTVAPKITVCTKIPGIRNSW